MPMNCRHDFGGTLIDDTRVNPIHSRCRKAAMTCEREDGVVAYVCGGATVPDFGAIAAMGFSAVVLDRSATWYCDQLIARAHAAGLIAAAVDMQRAMTPH